MEELARRAPSGSAVMVMLYGESPDESQGELVTVMNYDLTNQKVIITSTSMLYRTMAISFQPGIFLTSRWIDLDKADFNGLIGEHFKSLGKLVESEQPKVTATEEPKDGQEDRS